MSGETATAADSARRQRLAAVPARTLAVRLVIAVVLAFVAAWVGYKAAGNPRTFVVVGVTRVEGASA